MRELRASDRELYFQYVVILPLLLSLKSLQDFVIKSEELSHSLDPASASISSRTAIFSLALSLKGTGNEIFDWLIIGHSEIQRGTGASFEL